VFLAAYRDLASFDPARSLFSTWLFTIARNKSLNALKKRRPRPSDHPFRPTEACAPSDPLLEKEFYETLDKGLAALSAHQRTAFVLAECEELPYEMIAQIEGVRVGTVKSRISRAKAKLRSLLDGPGGDAV
jgi:RNA polymerase sigma-70 factor (ECF subfamily)